jgi:hypothetical protein
MCSSKVRIDTAEDKQIERRNKKITAATIRYVMTEEGEKSGQSKQENVNANLEMVKHFLALINLGTEGIHVHEIR